MLSRLSTENNKVEFNKSIITSINTFILLVIPISVGGIILSTPIVRILFQRGEFDARATYMTSVALVFYSLQDTKTPMINGSIAMGLNIILNISFVKFTNMQLAGLALTTSTSALVTIVLLFINLRIKIGPFGRKYVVTVFIKVLLSALLMALITRFVYNNLVLRLGGTGTLKEIITLATLVISGAIVYGICVMALRIQEVNVILATLKSKLKKA